MEDYTWRVERGRELGEEGAHVKGHNSGWENIGVCVCGDWTDPTMMLCHFHEVEKLLSTVQDEVRAWLNANGRGGEEIVLKRHCDVAATACPGLLHW